jgi:flotillin
MLAVYVAFMICALVGLARQIVDVPLHRIGVLSGRRHVLPDATVVGYRIVFGRTFRVPFVETFTLMPEMPGQVELRFQRIVLRDGSVFDVVVRTEVSFIRGDALRHAVERFLGQPTASVTRVASEIIEGVARRVLAEQTRTALEAAPADVDSAVAPAIERVAATELAAAGLVIQNTSLVSGIPESGQAYR